MASPQPSQALSKRSSDTCLMPPPPPPKRIKRPAKVLDEDVYTDALSHIIARDFFPGLLETQAQTEYLEAIDSNNNEWIREAGRRLHQAMTPGPGGRGRRGTSMATTNTPLRAGKHTQTPNSAAATPRGWVGDTPQRASSVASSTASDAGTRQRQQVDSSLSLGAFQAKYTSEDNESFNALLDKQNAKRANAYAFLHHGNKIPTNRQIAYRAHQQNLLDNASDDSTEKSLVPLRPSQDLNDRPAQVDSFTSRQGPRNGFMFTPDGLEETSHYKSTFQTAQEKSLAPPRSVSYAATRLPSGATAAAESSIPPSPSISAIDAAISGRPRPSSTDAGVADTYTGSETPRVNGWSFVDAEPTPSELGIPISDEEADRQEREAAMALLPRATDSKGGFQMQERSKREELLLRMVEKHDSQRRKPADARLAALKQHSSSSSSTSTSSITASANTSQVPRFASSPVIPRRAGTAATPSSSASAAMTPALHSRRPGGNLTPAARMLAASLSKSGSRAGSSGKSRLREGGFGDSDLGARGKSKTWTPTPARIKRG